MWRDLERQCAILNLPFRRPNPFPQNSLLAARVALVGLDEPWGKDFCLAVFRSEFGEGRSIYVVAFDVVERRIRLEP